MIDLRSLGFVTEETKKPIMGLADNLRSSNTAE